MTAAGETTEVTPDLLFQIASGFMAAKHLFVANEVGLFAHLADGPATLDELARRTGIAGRRLRILADAMVAWVYSSARTASTGTVRSRRPF
jgi:hypothetical protein